MEEILIIAGKVCLILYVIAMLVIFVSSKFIK